MNSYQLEGPSKDAYFHPQARFDLIDVLLAHANAAIDISDGCLQDLGHLVRASNVSADIDSHSVPVASDATLQDALWGGDDYELLITAAAPVEGFSVVGKITAGSGVHLDGEAVVARGYDHFRT